MSDELFSVSSRMRHSSVDAPWILLNLTTEEYVRCRPGSDSPNRRGYVDHEDTPWLRFDGVVLMRICWTLPMTRDNAEQIITHRGQ